MPKTEFSSKLSVIKEKQSNTSSTKTRGSKPTKSAPLLRFQNLVSSITITQSFRKRALQRQNYSALSRDDGNFEMSHATSPYDDDRRPVTTSSEAMTVRTDVLSRLNMSDRFRFSTKPNRKFQELKVQKIIKEILEDCLETSPDYNAEWCQQISPKIADDIKERVKRLVFPRYKIICHVTMGQVNRQCVQSASRCAWNEEFDNFAQYCVQTPTMYAIAVVYGVYAE